MTPREKLARVISPVWDSYPEPIGHNARASGKTAAIGAIQQAKIESLEIADHILARWPDIKDIVEREDEQ